MSLVLFRVGKIFILEKVKKVFAVFLDLRKKQGNFLPDDKFSTKPRAFSNPGYYFRIECESD